MKKKTKLLVRISILFIVLGTTINYSQEKLNLNQREAAIRKLQIAILDSVQIRTKSQLKIQWNNDNIAPNMIAGKLEDGIFSQNSASLELAAIKFIEKYKNVFALDEPKQELKIVNKIIDDLGNTHLKFNQYYKGLCVFGAQLVVHFNSRGDIYLFNGRYCPSFFISTQSTISNNEAIKIASNNSKIIVDSTSSELIIFPGLNMKEPKLAVNVFLFSKIKTVQQYIIDARNGLILFRDDGMRF